LGQLAVQDSVIYFIVNVDYSTVVPTSLLNGIRRLALGGTVESAVSTPNPVALALTPTRIVFTDDGPSVTAGVYVAPIDGGAATLIAPTSPPTALHVATDGVEAFFADTEGTKAVPLAGGDVRTLTSVTGDIGLAGSSVLVADLDGGAIWEVPSSAVAAPTALASNQSHPASPVACGTSVCWVNDVPEGCDSGASSAEVIELPPGATPTVLISRCTSPSYPAASVISDGVDVFFVGAGLVFAAPIGGGDVVPIGSDFVFWAAVDSCCVYQSDPTGIVGTPKPDQ
jgi:hypothetical protein